MKQILIIIGTRPEAIKMCPLVRELKTSAKMTVKVCLTGQHNNKDIEKILSLFDIKSDYELEVSVKQKINLHLISTNLLMQVTELLTKVKFDYVAVQGDTTSAYMSALAAYYLKVPVVHVEAGLRTHNFDNPFPEEFNRRSIALIAKYNFASSSIGYKNLIDEGVDKHSKLFYAGNTVVDALFYMKDKLNLNNVKKENLVTVTCHRRENWEYITNLCKILNILTKKHEDYQFVICAHPNPNVRQVLTDNINNKTCTILTDVNYDEFIKLLTRSKLVITDSGGVQEEVSVLDIPTLVTRKCTERVEGEISGIIKLVDLNDVDTVVDTFEKTLIQQSDLDKNKEINTYCLDNYKNGKASKNIVTELEALG